MPSAGHGRIYGAETHQVTLNSVEVASLQRFAATHDKCSKGWPTCFDVSTTATGIGASVEVKCRECGASENISDYESW